MAGKSLLVGKNLFTTFRSGHEMLKTVYDVFFVLNRGETIGIVGESGSGKSVTSLSVMKLIPNPPGKITNGEIIFHSGNNSQVDLVQASENQMRHLRGKSIAMVFQEPMTSL